MDAFPAVLKKAPNAKLIVAGANHHTRPGYWESIRDSQSVGSRVEFRGYVPEEDIPVLFRTASVVVMPYDSATGSSGPAHQACEYGVPIVCADLADFRDMAADEDMAVNFYKLGDAADLADQLVSILQSPEQQCRMAEQNFSAAIQMTLPSVVRNYLRWFELNRCKKEVGSLPLFPHERSFWQRLGFLRLGAFSAGWFRSELLSESGVGKNNDPDHMGSSPQSIELGNPDGWQRSETGD
jgi:glycosyltransferase involved in cell wall biosynthesis